MSSLQLLAEEYVGLIESVCRVSGHTDIQPYLESGFRTFCEASYGFDFADKDGNITTRFNPQVYPRNREEFAAALKPFKDAGCKPAFNVPIVTKDAGQIIPRRSEVDQNYGANNVLTHRMPVAVKRLVHKLAADNGWDMDIYSTGCLLREPDQSIADAAVKYLQSLGFNVTRPGETGGGSFGSSPVPPDTYDFEYGLYDRPRVPNDG